MRTGSECFKIAVDVSARIVRRRFCAESRKTVKLMVRLSILCAIDRKTESRHLSPLLAAVTSIAGEKGPYLIV